MATKENSDPDVIDFQPPRKRKAKPTGTRFKEPTTDSEMSVISKGFVLPNTLKSTAWAVGVFLEWRAERNRKAALTPETGSREECPEDLLDNPDTQKLNYWLSRFVTEVRRQDGQPYPPRSVHQILAGLQRKMLEKQPDAPKLLDSKEPAFSVLHRTCDTVYRNLHSQGIGTAVRHTPTFTPEEESKLRTTDTIGCTTPKNLQRVVFFFIGKRFCVRGGEEQRRLGPSQFLRTEDPDCYTYIEHGSKNRSGGLAQLRVENKCVPCYAVLEKSLECLVFLLDFYLSKLPE